MIKDFIRSETNKGAIINTDNNALLSYKRQRDAMRKMEMANLRIDKLETDISDIKNILHEMMEKLN